MTEILQLYKCEICGNLVEVVVAGNGELVCCGQPMKLLEADTTDAALEKHVPVIEIEGENKTVRVGSIPHPMINEHYIMFIEAISDDKKFVKRKYLFPGEEPIMRFKTENNDFYAREFCNIHGLWSNKK